MEKIPIDFSREIIFASSDKSLSNQMNKAEKEGKIKKKKNVEQERTGCVYPRDG